VLIILHKLITVAETLNMPETVPEMATVEVSQTAKNAARNVAFLNLSMVHALPVCFLKKARDTQFMDCRFTSCNFTEQEILHSIYYMQEIRPK
jgi:hypothetical protein